MTGVTAQAVEKVSPEENIQDIPDEEKQLLYKQALTKDIEDFETFAENENVQKAVHEAMACMEDASDDALEDVLKEEREKIRNAVLSEKNVEENVEEAGWSVVVA